MFSSTRPSFNNSLAETFNGIIWKIETDPKSQIIAIESRNISDRTTRFSAFNFATGECLFREAAVEDSWFWSLDKVYEGLIFLHSYVNESSPEHKGVIALNKRGNIEWQQHNITLYDILNEGLLVYNPRIQPRTFELLLHNTGKSIGKPQHEFNRITREILVPEIIDDLSEFNDFLPQNTVGPVFYLQHNQKDILAFHTATEKIFNQQLLVLQDKTVILKDFLARDIQKLNPEAFFIDQAYLFYIRNNKSEIVSYSV